MSGKYLRKKKSPVALPAVATRQALAQSRQNTAMAVLMQQIRYKSPIDPHPPASLGDFLPAWFKENIARGGAVLSRVSEVWRQRVPDKLLGATSLAGFHRGVLNVHVTSAAARMELHSLLRQGLLSQLQIATNGAVFRVRITIHHSPRQRD